MSYIIYEIGIFLQLFQLFVTIKSQCPEYFRYYRNETTGNIMGTVEIPTPPQDVPLHLRVILSVAATLPSKYGGRLELERSKEESVRSVLLGYPLFYRIHFPIQSPIPVVTSMILNEIKFCSGPPASGMVVTKITLEHSLYPPRVIIPLTDLLDFISNRNSSMTQIEQQNNNISKLDQNDLTTTVPTTTTVLTKSTMASTTTTTTSTTTTTAPSGFQLFHPTKPKPMVDLSCGLTNELDLQLQDEKDSLLAWPWLAAIFMVAEEPEFLCAGNLLTRQHVLTVAHCLKDEKNEILASHLMVSLGRQNIAEDKQEPGSVNVAVEEVRFHPDYTDPKSADSDLVVIKLMERVQYTPSIRPICLWMGRFELDSVVGSAGFIVGWSNDAPGRDRLTKPRASEVAIVSQEDCLRKNIRYIEVTSRRTFCAGSKQKDNACNGDSGSGFVMLHPQHNRYHLRGMVSLLMLDVNTRSCDPKQYVVYVDVAKYLQWIRDETAY